MRRADRLYRITDYLRSRRRTTAEYLAQRLGVSVRTVYRDIADLEAAGVPVQGTAGVGYTLARRIDLPPLMFARDELKAVGLGLRFVQAFGDAAVRAAAERAEGKIRGVLPSSEVEGMREARAYVPRRDAQTAAHLATVLEAVDAREVLQLAYRDEAGRETEREVWPLGTLFGAQAWSAVAWCELRQALRTFRLDRIQRLVRSGRSFPETPGRRLDDYFTQMHLDYGIPPSHFDPDR